MGVDMIMLAAFFDIPCESARRTQAKQRKELRTRAMGGESKAKMGWAVIEERRTTVSRGARAAPQPQKTACGYGGECDTQRGHREGGPEALLLCARKVTLVVHAT